MKLKFCQRDGENKPLTKDFPQHTQKRPTKHRHTKTSCPSHVGHYLFPHPAYEQNTVPTSQPDAYLLSSLLRLYVLFKITKFPNHDAKCQK